MLDRWGGQSSHRMEVRRRAPLGTASPPRAARRTDRWGAEGGGGGSPDRSFGRLCLTAGPEEAPEKGDTMWSAAECVFKWRIGLQV